MGEFVKSAPKKPYSKPKLTVYGTLRELTKSQGRLGRGDGGRNPRLNKTHIG